MSDLSRRSFIKGSILTSMMGTVGVKALDQGTAQQGKRTGPPVSCIPILLFPDMIQKKTMSVEDWIKMASRLQLDGIEMYEPYLASWKADYLSRLSDTVHNAGLAVSMFTSYADFSSADPAVRKAQVSNVKRAVDAAVTFKTRVVRITAGRWIDGMSLEETLRNVADSIRGCLGHAEGRGVTLALEDHPQIGTQITHFMRILELVGDPRLKVNLDTSNPMVSGDNAVELVKLVKDRVVHVHASDRNKDLKHTVAGTGAVDFPAIFSILKKAGFNSWISLEAGGTNGEESIRQGIEYVKSTWGPR